METLAPRYVTAILMQVGNQVPRYSGWKPVNIKLPLSMPMMLETKYRDIADGNLVDNLVIVFTYISGWKPSTAI